MKTIRNLTCLLLVALLLTACGQTAPSTPPKDHEQIIRDATTSLSRFSLEPVTVSHGEDYVIEWEDEGMEAHIRFLLVDRKGHNPAYSEDAVAYKDVFFKEFSKAAKKKQLETPQQQEEFMARYDWLRMTNQDGAVWQQIIDHLNGR